MLVQQLQVSLLCVHPQKKVSKSTHTKVNVWACLCGQVLLFYKNDIYIYIYIYMTSLYHFYNSIKSRYIYSYFYEYIYLHKKAARGDGKTMKQCTSVCVCVRKTVSYGKQIESFFLRTQTHTEELQCVSVCRNTHTLSLHTHTLSPHTRISA